MEQKNLTLKEALSKGNLKQFIKERIKQTGDKPKFDGTISSMVGKSEEVPAASKKRDSVPVIRAIVKEICYALKDASREAFEAYMLSLPHKANLALEGNDYVFCQAEWEAWQAAIAWRDKQVADALCTPEALDSISAAIHATYPNATLPVIEAIKHILGDI